jgi:hypothetical protein
MLLTELPPRTPGPIRGDGPGSSEDDRPPRRPAAPGTEPCRRSTQLARSMRFFGPNPVGLNASRELRAVPLAGDRILPLQTQCPAPWSRRAGVRVGLDSPEPPHGRAGTRPGASRAAGTVRNPHTAPGWRHCGQRGPPRRPSSPQCLRLWGARACGRARRPTATGFGSTVGIHAKITRPVGALSGSRTGTVAGFRRRSSEPD